jgi:PAS domain S-box-containing protein
MKMYSNREKTRVLYIEDDDAQRKTLSRSLHSKGYSVTVASSGQTGLHFFKTRSFDVILCDLNMPKMNGLDVLNEIRRHNLDIPFIILTAHGTVPMAVKATKKGADHFILKPAEINQIIIAIEQAIEKAKIQKQLRDTQDNLRMVSENVPDVVYSMNIKGEFISLSSSVKPALGYEPSELIGKSVFKIIHPDDRQRVKESFMRSMKGQGEKVKTLQFRMVAKTGEVKHFEISRKLIMEDGRIIRSDGTVRDITQRIQLENKLKEYHQEIEKANLDLLSARECLEKKNSEMEGLLKELSTNKDELQTILDTNSAVIILVDKKGIIKASNSRVTDFFGLSLDEVVNTSFNEFNEKIKDDFGDPDRFMKLIRSLKKNPGCVDHIDTQEFYKRGIRTIKHKQGLLSPECCRVQDKSKREIGLLWIFNDITQMKVADEQVHTIVNSSPIPTIISRLEDGKILYANKELASLVGLTVEEAIGQNTPDFYYNPEDRKIIVERLKRDGYLRNFETQIKKVDGAVVWMIFSLVVTQIGDEQVVLGWLYDISERKKSEKIIKTRLRYEKGLAACSKTLMKDAPVKEALTEALNHLLKASGTSRVYIFENFEDPDDGLCLRLTHEVCAPGVSSNLDDPVLQHGVYKQGFERWRKTLSKGKPIQGLVESFPQSERVILDPQGVLSILVLPLWVDGKWYGFIGFDDVRIQREWNEEDIRLLQTAADIVDDYIERRRFEEVLRVSEERFRSLVENAKDIIYSLTPNGEISYISPKFSDLLGYKISDYLGKSFSLLMYPDEAKRSVELFQRALKSGQRESGFEFRLNHTDGSLRWFISNFSAILDEKGDVMEIVGVAHDITEMKKVLDDLALTNKILRETQMQLVQSEKMAALGSLVAGIAHEINTPIGALSSMYDTLSKTLKKLKDTLKSRFPEEYEQHPTFKSAYKVIDDSNRVIKSGADRVINIVRRLKSFARLDEAELKTVDIHEGLEDTLTLIHHELKHNIKVIKNYGDIPPISCFPGQLNQVFLNLLINSKQAIKGKGTISIKTFAKDNKVHIVIMDNGSGIAKENLKKVFDPGFTTKGSGVGAGLGLSISYQIIQDHKGDIKVESELNKGTEFTIILPMDLEKRLKNGS